MAAAAALIAEIPETIKSNLQSMTIKKCVQSLYHCCSMLLTMLICCAHQNKLPILLFLGTRSPTLRSPTGTRISCLPVSSSIEAHRGGICLSSICPDLLRKLATCQPLSFYHTWIPLLWSTPGQLGFRSRLTVQYLTSYGFLFVLQKHFICFTNTNITDGHGCD